MLPLSIHLIAGAGLAWVLGFGVSAGWSRQGLTRNCYVSAVGARVLMETTFPITFEISGERYEVDSLWLRDEAQLGRHENSVRGAVLKLLEGQLADEWASAGAHDDRAGADDVRYLKVFSKFVKGIETHDARDDRVLTLIGFHPDERLVDVGYRQITEGELERMEQNLSL